MDELEREVMETLVLVENIYKELECTEEVTREFIKQSLDNITLFNKKQHDYGSNNISKFGEQGVLVRVSDKVERLITLSKKPPIYMVDPKKLDTKDLVEMSVPGKVIHTKVPGTSINPMNESTTDTWQDISIYATIALLVRKGKWK